MNFPQHLSLIMLPITACNSQCTYCFEEKSNKQMNLSTVTTIFNRLQEYAVETTLTSVDFYWQGGEITLLPPDFFYKMQALSHSILKNSGIEVLHYMQSNLLELPKDWIKVIESVFNGKLGTSLDYPNLYRKSQFFNPQNYAKRVANHIQILKDIGIKVGVISIPNDQSFAKGARDFYHYFTQTLNLDFFQVNFLFPGGPVQSLQKRIENQKQASIQFYTDLLQIYFENKNQITLQPFNYILDALNYKKTKITPTICVWSKDCSASFLSIGPDGQVGLCDCWNTSYPDFSFGNIHQHSIKEILSSNKRKIFTNRLETILFKECTDCDYLNLCFGGCPIRTFSFYNTLEHKDYYCYLYQCLFEKAIELQNQQV